MTKGVLLFLDISCNYSQRRVQLLTGVLTGPEYHSLTWDPNTARASHDRKDGEAKETGMGKQQESAELRKWTGAPE